jgi:sigma-E factor negative regulatory protein RseB
MKYKLFCKPFLIAMLALLGAVQAQAQTAQAWPSAESAVQSKNINDWLMRMHEASKRRTYVGTFVVSAGANMSSAKIWHVCDGEQQVELVESLTGAPRSVFRHNDLVMTFVPEQKILRKEKRESLGMFPDLLKSADSRIADFYEAKHDGVGRVAGVDADIVRLIPKDNLRFGYRIWVEKKNGLVVKLQTLSSQAQVLEQAAFSELQIGAPVKMDYLLQMMNKVEGYRVEQQSLVKTTATAEGWRLSSPIAGFMPMSCYKRPSSSASTASANDALQCTFSDGLASASLFVEPYDAQRHDRESSMALGATHTMTRKLGAHWLTVVGEVPTTTLQLFANALERKK